MTDTETRTPAQENAKPLRKRRKIWGRVAVGSLLVALVLCVAVGVMLALQAKTAYDELQKARSLTKDVDKQLKEFDFERAKKTTQLLGESTAKARDNTSGFLWDIAAQLPVYGDDVTALQVTVAGVDDIARQAMPRIVSVGDTLNPTSLAPVDGRINVAAIASAQDPLGIASDTIADVFKRTDAIDLSGVDPRLSEQIVSLKAELRDAEGTTARALDIATVAPGLLGADGPRNILVLFQNNAEVRTRGGNPGASAVLRTDNGKISMIDQAAANTYKVFKPGIGDIGANAEFYPKANEYIQNVTMLPHFPETGKIAKLMYERSGLGEHEISAVMTLDPVALSYLLKATGGVDVGGGRSVTQQNAVKLLLNDVYTTRATVAESDAFFAATAAAVFERVSSGASGAGAITAVEKSIDERRLLLWSSSASEQATLERYAIGGAFTSSTLPQGTGGIFLNSGTASKVSYYLSQKISWSPRCLGADPNALNTTDVTLALTYKPPANILKLPTYLKGNGRKAPAGTDKTLVTVYAPAGATVSSIMVNGTAVEYTASEIGGLSAAIVPVVTAPGGTSTVEAVFDGVTASSLALEATPLAGSTKLNPKSQCPSAS